MPSRRTLGIDRVVTGRIDRKHQRRDRKSALGEVPEANASRTHKHPRLCVRAIQDLTARDEYILKTFCKGLGFDSTREKTGKLEHNDDSRDKRIDDPGSKSQPKPGDQAALARNMERLGLSESEVVDRYGREGGNEHSPSESAANREDYGRGECDNQDPMISAAEQTEWISSTGNGCSVAGEGLDG